MMKQSYIPTRQNQPIEILFFPQDVLSFGLIIIAVSSAFGYSNFGILLAIYWVTKASAVKEKGRGYILHNIWNKGWLPSSFSKGMPDPLVKEYIR